MGKQVITKIESSPSEVTRRHMRSEQTRFLTGRNRDLKGIIPSFARTARIPTRILNGNPRLPPK
jgi:hypothetical protein